MTRNRIAASVALAVLLTATGQDARADAGGVSFWLPGTFGSLAAVPAQPGWSLGNVYYHTSVSAGADVATSRALNFRNRTVPLNVNINAELDAQVDIGIVVPGYTFASPVLGGRLTLSMMAIYGRSDADVTANVTGALGPIGFAASRSVSDTLWGFGDLYPQAKLQWNNGVHNYMVYGMANIPVGAYDAGRLANIGLGHWSIDGGGGYTYFNPATGWEASAVAGLTYNFINPDTDYQNGVSFHLDWGASRFISQQVHIGVVGYLYQQITGDSGAGATLGDFKSRVAGIGPQVGYIFPLGGMQGYINLKGYYEFAAQHRPEGFNVWLTFAISPAAASPPPPRRMVAK